METQQWSNFVEHINKKSYELARAFRDLWSLVMWTYSKMSFQGQPGELGVSGDRGNPVSDRCKMIGRPPSWVFMISRLCKSINQSTLFNEGNTGQYFN